jgi:hypothetical protein
MNLLIYIASVCIVVFCIWCVFGVISAVSGERITTGLAEIPLSRKFLLAFLIFCPIINTILAIVMIILIITMYINSRI